MIIQTINDINIPGKINLGGNNNDNDINNIDSQNKINHLL